MPSSLLQSSKSSDTGKALAFITVPELDANKGAAASMVINDDHVFENILMAPSTQGFIVSRPSGAILHVPNVASGPVEAKPVSLEPWSCSLPGGIGLLKW